MLENILYFIDTPQLTRVDHLPAASTSGASSSEISLANYMRSFENNINETTITDREKAFEEIESFNPPRLEPECNILEYWKLKRSVFPNLYKMALVLLAVPASQASVERSFSALKIILSDIRNKLSDESLQNILLLRLNSF